MQEIEMTNPYAGWEIYDILVTEKVIGSVKVFAPDVESALDYLKELDPVAVLDKVDQFDNEVLIERIGKDDEDCVSASFEPDFWVDI